MKEIECTCGELNCTTSLIIDRITKTINVAIENEDGGTLNRVDIELDANGIVDLINQLKQTLQELG